MSFLAPFTLWGLAFVALPVTIHLLVRRRAKRVDFPSLKFLEETPSFRLHLRRIRQPLLLALRAFALALLVLGFARPLATFNSASSSRTRVILLDASLSMQARGRAEAARERARTLINKLVAGERASLIAFSSDATVIGAMTSHPQELLDVLNGYQPTGGAADYAAGIAVANRLLNRETEGAAEIDLVSDFQSSGLEALKPVAHNAARVVAYPVGASVERNALLFDEAVTKRARGIELSASEIVSTADGRSGARRVWTIDAESGAQSNIEWRTEINNQITGLIRASAPDDFDGDDERFFAFAAPRDGRVLLVDSETESDFYLNAALEAASNGQSLFTLERKRELPLNVAELNAYSLVVITLQGAPRPSDMKVVMEYVRNGGAALLLLARDLDTNSWSAFAQEKEGRELPFLALARTSGNQGFGLGTADQDASWLRSLDASALAMLRAVSVRSGYTVTPRAGAATLMRWNDGATAFVAAQVGEGSVLMLATSPEHAAGSLGASGAFPALVSSIASAATALRTPVSYTLGEAVHLNIAPLAKVKVTNSEGQTITATARELAAQPFHIFQNPGIYRLEFAGQIVFMAFNAPASESDRALAAPDEIKRHFPDENAAPTATNPNSSWREAAERRGNLWRLFLSASFLLLAAELFFAMRGQRVRDSRPGSNRTDVKEL